MEGLTWLTWVVLFFGWPLLIVLSILLYYQYRNAGDRRERAAARKTYEKVMAEKLDVVKTAIVMGYSHSELIELDRRLATLIGEERLKGLSVEKGSPKSPTLDSVEIEREIEAVAALAREHRQRV